jgi:hypothetical protein
MLLRREHNHRRKAAVYLFAGVVALAVVGVWLGQTGLLFHTASTEEFQTNFLKLQNDIDAGMTYGNAQVGSEYPDMVKTPEQKLEEIADKASANVKMRTALNAAAAQVVERLNANASAEEAPAPTDEISPTEPVAQ